MLMIVLCYPSFSQLKLQVIKDDLTYDQLFSSSDGMIRFKKADKFGYLNKSGAELIAAQFDDAYSYNDGYAGAKKDGKWGIIDKTGKWKIQPQFLYVSYKVKNGVFQYYDSSKWGLRDLQNNIVIPAKCSSIEVYPKFIKATLSSPTTYDLFTPKGRELLTQMNLIATDDKSDIAFVRRGDVNKIMDSEGRVTCDSLDSYTFSSLKYNLILLKNKKGSFGICDRTGKMVVPFDMYADIFPDTEEDLYKVSKMVTSWGMQEKKYGFIDRTGKIIIPVNHSFLNFFKNGFLSGRDSAAGKLGYYNNKGVLVIPKKFETADEFGLNGLAKVSLKVNDKKEEFYINKNGVEVTKTADDFPPFYEGVGILKKPDHLIIIDKNKVQKKVEGYTDQWNISEGIFPVKNKEGKMGYVDLTGKLVIPCQYDMFGSLHYGLVSVGKKVNNKTFYGYAGKDGKEILPGLLSEAGEFTDGYALVKDESSPKKYFINTMGEKQILPRTYAEIYSFKDGYAVGKVNPVTGTNPTWVFIDTKLKEADSVTSPSLYFFADGYSLITGTEYRILDKSFKQVGSFKYENIDSIKTFSEGLMCFKDKTAKKWGFKNPKGETVIEPQFLSTSIFKEGLCAVLTDKGWGYINPKGTEVIQANLESASNFNSGFAVAKKGGKYGYIDKTGKFWLEPKYNRLTDFTDGKAVIKVDNVYQLLKQPG